MQNVASTPTPREVFLAALKLAPDAWPTYLNRACGGDSELRARVQALLDAHAAAGSFLHPVVDAAHSPTLAERPIAELPGMMVGPYKLLEQIGEGGFGIVFMAEQTAPVKRKVALKVIKPGMDTRQVIARFEAERQALALMDHPNIARVLDAGATRSGRPFFVMELVKGLPITDYCDERQLSPRERLELFVSVCHAVQHAHQKGVIHRDIKPSNVLVTLHDDKPVVKVIDFGIAKATSGQLTDKTLFTGFAQLIGTPLYMSPEQAALSAVDVDTRSDIYSLGVLLYELLTGTTPFDKNRMQRAAFDEVRRIIREEEPQKPSTRISSLGNVLPSVSAQRRMEPRRLSQLVRGDLDWIVMKALEKDRTRRFETANGFAADVLHYLADEPVAASPPSAGYRFRKFARRNKGALATGALLSIVLVSAVVVLAVSNVVVRRERNAKAEALAGKVQALGEKEAALAEKQAALAQAQTNFNEAKRQEGLAREQERIATRQTKLANRRLYASQMNLATQAWRSGDIARVFELLEGQRPGPGDEDLRSFEWYYLWRLCNSGERKFLRGHRGAIYSVAVSPDSSLVASASWDGTVRLWNAATGEELKVLRGHSIPPWFVTFAPDGKTLASCGQETDCVIVWDVESGEPRHVFPGHCSAVAYSPDSSRIAGGIGSAGALDVEIWDVATGAVQERLPAAGEVQGYLPDGRTLVTVTGKYADGKVKIWDLPGGELRRTIVDERDARIGRIALSPDGTRLAMSAPNSSATVWDIATGTRIKSLPVTQSGLPAFSPDGRLLAVAGSRTVTLWDIESGRKLAQDTHRDIVQALAFSPDGKTLVSSTTGVIKLWDMAPPEESVIVAEAPDPKSLRFDPSGQQLFVGSTGRTIVVDVAAGKQTAALPAGRVMAISDDCNVLAGTSGTDALAVYSRDGSEIARFPLAVAHDYHAIRMAVSADGNRIAAHRQWHGPAAVYLQDLATRQSRIFTPKAPSCSVMSVDLSPDGRLLAAGFQFRTASVWDVSTGEEKLEVRMGSGMVSVLPIAFAPDGKAIAAGTEDGSVALWDIESGKQLAAFRGHAVRVFFLAFSPDGATLATGAGDEMVRLWDVATGQERCALPCPGQHVAYLRFSPDGTVLAAANHEGTIRLWRAPRDTDAVARRTHQVR